MSEAWAADDTRKDGVRIVRMTDAGRGHYIVIGPGGKHVTHCPHCSSPMTTVTRARLVADLVYPYGHRRE